MAGRMFIGGTSTKLEVDALMEVEVVVGGSLSYEEIERITGVKCREQLSSGQVGSISRRFKAVVHAWRKKLLNNGHGIQTKARDGYIHFLNSVELLDQSIVKMTHVGRAAGRVVRDVRMIRPGELRSEEQRDRHLLLAREARELADHADRARKVIAAPKVTETRPFPRLIG
jgi:hypothetical protein